MTEISKRILSSFLLFLLFYLAIIIQPVLFILLIVIFYEIFYEFYVIFSKILKSKFKLFLTSFTILSYIFFLIYTIWLSLVINPIELKLTFLFIISICISTDIGGYIFGKILKGKKLTKISPNKTYSGMFGSFLLSILISFFLFKNIINFKDILFYSILISSISQIGDLSISYLKRKSKIKDTGKLIPGHGGILDRLDGIIFAIPLILFIGGFYEL